jgi:tetratricopeptide (TPR) repeat protein
MQNNNRTENLFAQRRLPLLVGLGALLLYLVTLSPWISFHGFATLAKASGWDWRPNYIAPLDFIVTFPVRWVRVAWQPAVANFIAALFTSLTLGLLARSVAILPHDRTREQRQFERSEYSFLSAWWAWLPPLTAVLVCGLQMTVWENAVVNTGEALNLFLFAYVVRCLLEFRIQERESWLTRAAFVYGLAITNNYAMIPLLPLFVGAIVWIRGRTFFNWRFCLRMALFGLLGLSFYLVLPLIGLLSGSEQSFWEFLKVNLNFQKSSLTSFPRYLVFLLSLVSILPLLFMGIKWPASFGDINAAGTALTNLMTHIIHVVFLLAAIYVAFDPPFSPRRLGQGRSFLLLIYLGALSVGYFVGYFLLVFNPKAPSAWGRRSRAKATIGYLVTGLTWILAIGAPIGLLARNLSPVRSARGPEYSQFGKLAASSLPPEGAIVLSDDSIRLFALRSALVERGAGDKYVLVDSTGLERPSYHAYLARQYPQVWPAAYGNRPAGTTVDQVSLIELIYQLSRSKPVYYLHPSFGYYFEGFYATPKGIVYQLTPYTPNSRFEPKLTGEEIKQIEAYWKKLKEGELRHLPAAVKLALRDKKADGTSYFMGAIYSKAVDDIGVRLQRQGEFDKARAFFEYALQLNPDNVSALINVEYNHQFALGNRDSGPPSENVARKLSAYGGGWEMMMQYNGPVDEPNSCFLVAQLLARGHNYRQAARELDRSCELMTTNTASHIALAALYVQAGRAEDSFRKISEIRSSFPQLGVSDQLTLAECEAWAYVLKNDLPAAQKTLQAAQERFPDRAEPYKAMSEIYLNRRDVTNALATLDKLVRHHPDNVDGLINYAALQMRQEHYSEAIPYLNRAVQLQPENVFALLNRGIANFQTGHLDAARQDYETLERHLPKPTHVVHFALGEIAFKSKQKKVALEHYQKYLELAPRGLPEIQTVQDRIKAIKTGTI